jgi:hypothetical protein
VSFLGPKLRLRNPILSHNPFSAPFTEMSSRTDITISLRTSRGHNSLFRVSFRCW